jgi:uncharacterized metal-binding protein
MNFRGHVYWNLLIFTNLIWALKYWVSFDVSMVDVLIMSISFWGATFLLSPDLDIHSQVYNNFGPIKKLFLPYQKMFKHRGISHMVVIGTMSRVAYVVLILVAGAYLVEQYTEVIVPWGDILPGVIEYHREGLWALSGVVLADLGHIMADRIPKRWRL